MDSAEPDPSLDITLIKQMEQHALKLILSGVKKKKAVEVSKLPYQPGTKKYFSFVKRAGTIELCNVLTFLLAILLLTN